MCLEVRILRTPLEPKFVIEALASWSAGLQAWIRGRTLKSALRTQQRLVLRCVHLQFLKPPIRRPLGLTQTDVSRGS